MRNSIFILFASLTTVCSGQQWGGSASTSGLISRSGNVEIGGNNFNNPSRPLSLMSVSTAKEGLEIWNSGSGPASLFLFQGQGGSGRNYSFSSDGNGNLSIDDCNLNGSTIYNYMHFDGMNKKIGIGTSSPGYKLEVAAATTANDGIMVRQTNIGYSAGLYLNHSGGGKNWALLSHQNGNLYFNNVTGTTYPMMIDGTSGNIGMGTTFPPGSKLDVQVSNNLEDGVTIRQQGTGKASLILSQGSTAKYWGLLADATGNLSIKDLMAGADRLFIAASGNIGIGNTAASQKLDVTGNVKFSGALMPNNAAGSPGQILQSAGPGQPPVWTNGGGALSGGATNYITKWTGPGSVGTSVMYDNGTNVGIGNTIASEKLHITGNLKIDGRQGINCIGTLDADIDVQSVGSNTAGIRILARSNEHEARLRVQNWYTGYDFKDDNTGIGRISAAGGINLISFKSSGMPGFEFPQVWIGAKAPSTPSAHTDFKLAVEGKIVAQEIIVTVNDWNWADYVFEKDYKLNSLEFVESYINKNKHLPNIPSASELDNATNGLNVGKMQNLQMEKIEEIFLYLIDLKKQVSELQKENATLKSEISEIKSN